MQVTFNDQGLPIETRAKSHRVHQTNTTFTNEYGEFIIGIRGPIIPLIGVPFDLGEPPSLVEQFEIPAPIPLVSLFNPNRNKVYWVPSGKAQHYFANKEAAQKALEEARASNVARVESRKIETAGNLLTPSVVHAAGSIAPAPEFILRVLELKLSKMGSADVYFAVQVNNKPTQVDEIPDASSRSSQRLSVEEGKTTHLEGFDIPVGREGAKVGIKVFAKRFFLERQLGSVDVDLVPPRGGPIRSYTAQSGNLQIKYEILPPVTTSCTGIKSNTGNFFRFVLWVDIASEFLNSIGAVQYDLGPAFDSRLIRFPIISKETRWMYTINVYSPEIIESKITFTGSGSRDITSRCSVDERPSGAYGAAALSRAYSWDEQFDRALQFADEALKADPNLEVAMLGRAEALAKLGSFDAAMEQYQRAVKLPQSSSPSALNAYAWFLANTLPVPSRTQLQEAKKMAELAVDQEPSAINWDTLGWALYKLGDFKEAVNALENGKQVLLRNQGTGIRSWQSLHYHLGYIQVGRNRPIEAAQAFKEVIAFDTAYRTTSQKKYVEDTKVQLKKLSPSP